MADSGITQLQMVDTVTGSGAEARPGRVVSVHYTGWLYDASKPDKRGAKFDSSKDRKEPFDFPLGGGQGQGRAVGKAPFLLLRARQDRVDEPPRPAIDERQRGRDDRMAGAL